MIWRQFSRIHFRCINAEHFQEGRSYFPALIVTGSVAFGVGFS